MNRILTLFVSLGFATALLCAAEGDVKAKPAKEPAAPAAAKKKTAPFVGTLKKVDEAAMAITVGSKTSERVIYVTSETRFRREGKPATLTDGVVGEEVAGVARIAEGGRWEAQSVRWGAKPESEKPKKAPRAGRTAKPKTVPQ